jgi:hypothetical protein
VFSRTLQTDLKSRNGGNADKVLRIKLDSVSGNVVGSLCPFPKCKAKIVPNVCGSTIIMTCAVAHDVDRPIRVDGFDIAPIVRTWSERMWKALNHRKAVWMLPLQFQLNMSGVMQCITRILCISPDEVQQRETKTFLYEVSSTFDLLISIANPDHLFFCLFFFLFPVSHRP